MHSIMHMDCCARGLLRYSYYTIYYSYYTIYLYIFIKSKCIFDKLCLGAVGS